jgi:predicted RNA binding protein YcfA (HicA-like mRNA interferase family)
MPKLPAIKPRQIIRFLEKNGFVLDHTSGSHYIYYHPVSHRRVWFRSTIAIFPKAL